MTSTAVQFERDESTRAGAETILVVDDDQATRGLIAAIVQRRGSRPVIAASVAEARDVLAREHVDLVVTDLNMPGVHGLDLLAELSAASDAPPALVVSGTADRSAKRAALLLGARAVVEKPFGLTRLRDAIDSALASPP